MYICIYIVIACKNLVDFLNLNVNLNLCSRSGLGVLFDISSFCFKFTDQILISGTNIDSDPY